MMTQPAIAIGTHLKQWRQRRHLSQLELAMEAEISARHLSFMETGRSTPSRDMVLRLAERLDVPLRERNVLLVSAGFAPAFPQRDINDPAMTSARQAIETVLKAHEPSPALAIDRGWNLVAANASVMPLLVDVAPALLQGQVNVLRLALHPDGLAKATINLHEWRAHLLERLQRQCEATADAGLVALLAELKAYPVPPRSGPPHRAGDAVVVPLRLRIGGEMLSFMSTTMVFGTPLDITLSELALETFFAADEATARWLRALAKAN